MALLGEGFVIKIISGNDKHELEQLLNEFILSGTAEEIDDDIQYYLHTAYVKYKPKDGVARMTVYHYTVGNQKGIILAPDAVVAEGVLASNAIRGASITPTAMITTENSPRLL